jgi:hypothetical protein
MKSLRTFNGLPVRPQKISVDKISVDSVDNDNYPFCIDISLASGFNQQNLNWPRIGD